MVLLLMYHRVSVWGHENILEIDIMMVAKHMKVINITEWYTYKWLNWPILCYIHFPRIKNLNKIEFN